MGPSNANKHGRSNDPVWQLLAECPLSECVPENETGDVLMTGLLFQTIRNLAVPPDCLDKIKRTLIEFVIQTRLHFNQGKGEFPVVIRLFYGKELIDPVNSTKTVSNLQVQQTIEPTQMIPPVDTKIFGGWGFFVIERARYFPGGASVDSPNFIDLYLYQEGE